MSSQDKFFKTLRKYPRIANLWNEKTANLDLERLKEQLNVMSSGERAMALFFAAIWHHENSDFFNFDLVDAVSHVDELDRLIIIEWITNPFYP